MRTAALYAYALGFLLTSCDGGASSAPSAPRRAAVARPLEIVSVSAGDEDVRALVTRERAARPGRPLLVYVGAPWCEPCRRFHEAAAGGKLDAAFPGLVLLELDADRDGERLKRAGYSSRLIPLFAVPGPDGGASGRQIEGSIKGDGAVAEISPRLAALLGER